MRDFLARHRPIAASMHVARRKTWHMAEKRSRYRPIALFVYVADGREGVADGREDVSDRACSVPEK